MTDALARTVELLGKAFEASGVDPADPDAGVRLAIAGGLPPAFSCDPSERGKAQKPRENAGRDLTFMSFTSAFLVGARMRGETMTIARAQRLAMKQMGLTAKTEKNLEKLRLTLKRVADRKMRKVREQAPPWPGSNDYPLVDEAGLYILREPGQLVAQFYIAEIERDMSQIHASLGEYQREALIVSAFRALQTEAVVRAETLDTWRAMDVAEAENLAKEANGDNPPAE